ncbi:MAG: hypothetical protein K2X93_14235, partial [Candidatus Obscuribacterales bacterium]|nr:hypothetical protein [Candidatus Obscuribacterales bacterium]
WRMFPQVQKCISMPKYTPSRTWSFSLSLISLTLWKGKRFRQEGAKARLADVSAGAKVYFDAEIHSKSNVELLAEPDFSHPLEKANAFVKRSQNQFRR